MDNFYLHIFLFSLTIGNLFINNKKSLDKIITSVIIELRPIINSARTA